MWIALGIPSLLVFYVLSSGPMLHFMPARLGVTVYQPVIRTFGASPLWQPWLEFWGATTSRSACINNLRQIDAAVQEFKLEKGTNHFDFLAGSTNNLGAPTNGASNKP